MRVLLVLLLGIALLGCGDSTSGEASKETTAQKGGGSNNNESEKMALIKQPMCKDISGLDLLNCWVTRYELLGEFNSFEGSVWLLKSNTDRVFSIPKNYTGVGTICNADGEVSAYFQINNGKLHGEQRVWQSNEMLITRLHHNNGNLDGLQYGWYKNGKLSHELNYKNGKEEGLSKKWHENGQLMLELNFKDGQRDGLIKEWYENGRLFVQINYKDGLILDDKLVYYRNDGSVKSTEFFKEGKLVRCEGDCR